MLALKHPKVSFYSMHPGNAKLFVVSFVSLPHQLNVDGAFVVADMSGWADTQGKSASCPDSIALSFRQLLYACCLKSSFF